MTFRWDGIRAFEPEYTFNWYGERGAVDALAWHADAPHERRQNSRAALDRGPRPYPAWHLLLAGSTRNRQSVDPYSAAALIGTAGTFHVHGDGECRPIRALAGPIRPVYSAAGRWQHVRNRLVARRALPTVDLV